MISLLITNCKKQTTSNRPATTYTVDSIQIFDDSVYSYTILKNGHDWPNFSNTFAPNASNFAKTVSGDTTKYIETAYEDNNISYPWFTSIELQLKGARPIYYNTIGNVEGMFGQNGAENWIANYKYDMDRIIEIKKSFSKYWSFIMDESHLIERTKDSFGLQYAGNLLTGIVNISTSTRTLGIEKSFNTTMEYSNNIPNQKDLIGIDLNDLFLPGIDLMNNLRSPFAALAFSVPVVGYYIGLGNGSPTAFIMADPSNEILNNLSCNTNSEKLIEKINYTNYTISGISMPDFSMNINYTFDTDFNNRVKELTLLNTLANRTTMYKISYHP